MPSIRYPGWTCMDPHDLRNAQGKPFGVGRGWEIDEGTLPRTLVPPPGIVSYEALERMARERRERLEDEEEFKLLMQKDPGGAATGIVDANVDQYLKHRDAVFGSRAEYVAFAAEADAEIDAEPALRKVVEYKKYPRSQTIFYRWVRKAYMTAGVEDVPALIKLGLSKKLQDALKKVSKQYGHDVKPGGFSPRPQKNPALKYYLGTLSEHAMGTAMDIEYATNPIVSPGDWTFIETLCKKHVDRSKTRWEKDPKALWTDVKGLNDAFVAKVASEVKRINDERAAAAKAAAEAAAKPKEGAAPAKGGAAPAKAEAPGSNPAAAPKAAVKPREPIEEVLSGHPELKNWVNGFFTLEWALVEALHDAGFLWGVTFTNVDLHHFELH